MVITDKCVTLEEMWQFEKGILSSKNDENNHGRQLRDICLSFASYKLILRRCAGYTVYQASQKKTWEFVCYGLLGDKEEGKDQYIRPFKVIEGYFGVLFQETKTLTSYHGHVAHVK